MGNNSLDHIGTTTLTTKRLVLRKFDKSDAEDMFMNWTADKEVARYTLWVPNESLSETKEYLNDLVQRYESNQYYHWAIVYNECVIGSISIAAINNYMKTCYVGYTLGKEYWNKGIATEALEKIIDFMVNTVGFSRVYAFHEVENVASGKVMRKCNMEFVKRKNKFFLTGKRHLIECDIYCYNDKNSTF